MSISKKEAIGQLSNAKRDVTKWREESIKRGKEIEKVIQNIDSHRHLLPESFINNCDVILTDYIERNQSKNDVQKRMVK